MTAAVHQIDVECPTALVQKACGANEGSGSGGGDALDVDIDALDSWTFSMVEQIISPSSYSRRLSRMKEQRSGTGGRKKSRPNTGGGGGE